MMLNTLERIIAWIRKRKAKPFLKILIKKAKSIKELVGIFLNHGDWSYLDFQFVLDIPEGVNAFEIQSEISTLFGEMMDLTIKEEKKYPFALDLMDYLRGQEDVDYLRTQGYTEVWVR